MVNDGVVGVSCSEARAVALTRRAVAAYQEAGVVDGLHEHVQSFDMVPGDNWLWENGHYAVLSVTSVDEALRTLDEFDVGAWELVGMPRPGLTVYRRATWWDRLTWWLR